MDMSVQVIFRVNTEDKDDLAFIRELVAGQPHYRIVNLTSDYFSWDSHYSDLVPGHLYIKIDDDVVFIQVCKS